MTTVTIEKKASGETGHYEDYVFPTKAFSSKIWFLFSRLKTEGSNSSTVTGSWSTANGSC